MARRLFALLAGALLLLCGGAILSSTAALARASLDSLCVLPGSKVKRYYEGCEKDGGQRAKFEETSPDQAAAPTPAAKTKRQELLTKAPTNVAAAPVVMTANPLDSKACHDGWNTHLAIGDSFSDLNFLNTANCNGALAKGAQFSWSRDRIALNDQWSAKGAVAEELVWIRPGEAPDGAYLNMWAIAPTVNFQRVTNSNTAMAAQNANVLSYGFSSEALFDHVDRFWQVYARARANVNADFSGLTHSYSTTAEFQALSDTYGIGRNFAVGTFAYFWFIPLVRAQYFERESKLVTDPIFSAHNQVLRAGPVLSFNLIPQDTKNVDPSKPPPPPQWLFNVTYSWYQDFFSSHTFQHVNPTITYNFSDNIGLTLGYERGQIETTGKKIDLTTISLSVKN
jgi:hypothetical protein